MPVQRTGQSTHNRYIRRGEDKWTDTLERGKQLLAGNNRERLKQGVKNKLKEAADKDTTLNILFSVSNCSSLVKSIETENPFWL